MGRVKVKEGVAAQRRHGFELALVAALLHNGSERSKAAAKEERQKRATGSASQGDAWQ
jgi:hypothetical protein